MNPSIDLRDDHLVATAFASLVNASICAFCVSIWRCINWSIASNNYYGAIINRQLKKGDELTRIYTLSFRQTEKGWMGFNAR